MDFKIMKKIVFGFLMTMGLLNAQNNLVFNRVLEMAITSTNTATVPEGKVWKIESATQAVYVDKPNVDYGIPISNQSFATSNGNIIWLSENSTIKVSSGQGKVSILEFIVVPTSTGTGSGSGGGGVSSDGLVIDQVVSIKYESNQLVFGTLTVPPGKIFKLNSFTSYRVYSGDNIQCINSDSFMFGDYPIGNSNYGLEGSHRYFTEGDHIIRKYGTSCNSNNVVVIDGAFYHSN